MAVLQKALKEEQYQAKPVKRVYIPKKNGTMRPLGIPTIRDRIVQTVLLIILEPIFEADFSQSSFGFRPEKSTHDAVREIYTYLNRGCDEVYDVDLEKYYDTVEHWKLMKLMAIHYRPIFREVSISGSIPAGLIRRMVKMQLH